MKITKQRLREIIKEEIQDFKAEQNLRNQIREISGVGRIGGAKTKGYTSPTTQTKQSTHDTNVATYAYSDGTQDGYFTVDEFANGLEDEGDVGIINSVQYYSSGSHATRSRFNSTCSFQLIVDAGSGDLDTEGYGAAFASEAGPAELVRPGDGAAWEYSDLEDVRVKVVKANTVVLRLSYLVLRVDYDLPAASNATFFGANF